MIKLIVASSGRPIAFPLTETLEEVTAGSLPDNAVYLPYKGISRRHFSVFRKGNVWSVRDLGSTNGTSVNGKRISESPIQAGDLIQVGTVQIRVESFSDEVQSIDLTSDAERSEKSQATDKVGVVPLGDADPVYSFPKLVFPEELVPLKSPEMLEVYRKIHSICESDVNVLLVGETGTGKEMIARMIHASSPYSTGPFLAINCAAIPDELAEAELFGIGEKVATNVSQRKGKMALADKGTLFLDELSAFPYELQAKVLRAVEEKSIMPLGENRAISVDFRLISATNQDPSELIRNQKLREDLYHRLATVEIYLPPLRERKEDLEIMIPALLRQLAKKENKHLPGISKRLMALLLNYQYPGNIRELINILRSMTVLAHPGEILDVHLISEKLLRPRGSVEPALDENFGEKPYDLRKAMQGLNKQLILRALSIYDGNIPKTAAHLKITTFGLRKMMKRLGIKKGKERP